MTEKLGLPIDLIAKKRSIYREQMIVSEPGEAIVRNNFVQKLFVIGDGGLATN